MGDASSCPVTVQARRQTYIAVAVLCCLVSYVGARHTAAQLAEAHFLRVRLYWGNFLANAVIKKSL